MSLRRKAAALAACAALAAMLSAAGTYAYLTSTDSDVNALALGNVRIALSERGAVAQEDATHEYPMVAGAAVAKDPKVTVRAGSADCWLFVRIDESANLRAYVAYEVAEGWTQLMDGPDAAVPGVWYREVSANSADQVFSVLEGDQVNVVDGADLGAVASGEAPAPALAFTAFAVQRSGVADALTAWGLVGASAGSVSLAPEDEPEGEASQDESAGEDASDEGTPNSDGASQTGSEDSPSANSDAEGGSEEGPGQGQGKGENEGSGQGSGEEVGAGTDNSAETGDEQERQPATTASPEAGSQPQEDPAAPEDTGTPQGPDAQRE